VATIHQEKKEKKKKKEKRKKKKKKKKKEKKIVTVRRKLIRRFISFLSRSYRPAYRLNSSISRILVPRVFPQHRIVRGHFACVVRAMDVG